MRRAIILFGFVGGLLFIATHILETKLYYVAGILFPIFGLLSIWLALRHVYRKKQSCSFLLFFKTAIGVFLVSFIINFIYIIAVSSQTGITQNNITAFLMTMGVGLVISLLTSYIFKLYCKGSR